MVNKILVILGSTSTGKTDLALQLAKKFNGELVSCDSRQVYTGLDIGTGKLPGKEVAVRKGDGFWEIDGIKIWMYDVVDPGKQYTVYDYIEDAGKVIDKIIKRGNLPIIVGGSGLYLKALLEGLSNLVIPVDEILRKNLKKLSKEQLQGKLQQISFDKWKSLNESDKQNPRRLVRAIEIIESSNLKPQNSKLQLKAQNYHTLKLGLMAPRDVLYKRINERVIGRIDQGMIEEAKKMHKTGLSLQRMRQLGLEYGVLAGYLEGKINNRKDLIQILQGKIHGYARRQMTWFKKVKDINWFDITGEEWLKKVERKVNSWYYSGNDQTY